jgi:transposase, IS30 family
MGREASGYKQLGLALREEISRGLASGLSQAGIARQTGRHRSTISREVKRAWAEGIGYRAHWAHARAGDAARRKGRRPKLADGVLKDEVHARLLKGHSPRQVSCSLVRDFGDNAHMQASHETIYQALYVMPRNALKERLVQAALRQGHQRRRPRSKLPKADRPKVRLAGGVSIHERPAEVEGRTVPGHWEGDLIKGEKNRSEVGVLLERQSRRVILARLPDAKAESVRHAFESAFRLMPPPLLKTLTYDQGSEMAEHALLAQNVGLHIYFADAHSPWQKGAIENANGLLRQYLPKGTNLSIYSQAELDEIAEKLNDRPRECLGWRTPNEVWAEILKQNEALA